MSDKEEEYRLMWEQFDRTSPRLPQTKVEHRNIAAWIILNSKNFEENQIFDAIQVLLGNLIFPESQDVLTPIATGPEFVPRFSGILASRLFELHTEHAVIYAQTLALTILRAAFQNLSQLAPQFRKAHFLVAKTCDLKDKIFNRPEIFNSPEAIPLLSASLGKRLRKRNSLIESFLSDFLRKYLKHKLSHTDYHYLRGAFLVAVEYNGMSALKVFQKLVSLWAETHDCKGKEWDWDRKHLEAFPGFKRILNLRDACFADGVIPANAIFARAANPDFLKDFSHPEVIEFELFMRVYLICFKKPITDEEWIKLKNGRYRALGRSLSMQTSGSLTDGPIMLDRIKDRCIAWHNQRIDRNKKQLEERLALFAEK